MKIKRHCLNEVLLKQAEAAFYGYCKKEFNGTDHAVVNDVMRMKGLWE